MKIILIITLLLIISFCVYMVIKKMYPMETKQITDYLFLPFISKVKENTKAFGEKVITICNYLGFPASWLMLVMNNESGVNSHIKNPTSSASGLIQFMDATAKSLGTTTEKLRAMSNIEQLDYVKKYFEPYKNVIKHPSDVYLAVFFPKALFQNDNYVFPKWASDANKIFDINKDGTLTKKEFKDYFYNKYKTYLS